MSVHSHPPTFSNQIDINDSGEVIVLAFYFKTEKEQPPGQEIISIALTKQHLEHMIEFYK